ncbi:MAG TPA: NAD(P)-binding domain-containing protein [Candidatus Sumerlaeota bacterium]|nr:NAD(P)-binding domain-containing protein [Candidatus Sumerlaeota bacterium]HPK02183.1 NAD(P)-binding domain-containing protein [Candidatus Sumerlaeota bacterium]
MLAYETQIAIVGSGPAGLAAALTLGRAGYDTLILERGRFAHGVANWPVYMKLFSTTDLVELCGYPLAIPDEKPDRRQYLRYLQRFATDHGLAFQLRHEVRGVEGEDGRFIVRGVAGGDVPFEARCQKVVLATGAYDHPAALNVPGEDLPKVSHYYTEVNDYFGRKVLIVGGRHSAAETALELYRAGVEVTICHRRAEFSGLKYWIAPDLANRIKEGGIRAIMPAHVREIRPDSVVIQHETEGPLEIENDAVLALTGYHPDPEFLGRLTLPVDEERKQPVFDPRTFESPRPGIYMIGVMLAGNISGAIFIENSRYHGERVLEHLRQRGFKPAAEPGA